MPPHNKLLNSIATKTVTYVTLHVLYLIEFNQISAEMMQKDIGQVVPKIYAHAFKKDETTFKFNIM